MSLSGFVWETETGPSTTAQLGPPFVRERPATGRFAHRHDPCMHPLPSAAAIGPSAVQHGIDTRISASESVCEWCKAALCHNLPTTPSSSRCRFCRQSPPPRSQPRFQSGTRRGLSPPARVCVAPGFAQFLRGITYYSCKPAASRDGVCK